MKAKKKLIVSMLVVAFVLLSIIATVAIAFALTQQTIKTSLNIGYTVEDIDGTASATFTIGGVTENLTAMKGENVIGDTLVFKAGDTENVGNLMFPEDALALTAQNDNVVIQYTYSNTGAKHYIASMDFDANIEADNMKVEYSIDGVTYSEDRYAVVVPANTSNKSYWIKISIEDKAKSASFTGDFNWLLSGCDPQSKEYLSLPSITIQETATANAFAISVSGTGEYGSLVIPGEVNGVEVKEIASSSSLSLSQKEQVHSVYIPSSVEVLNNSAFSSFANLKNVTFEQNEIVSGASANSGTGLTTMGEYVFYGCSSLKSIDIPNTVTSIGKGSFYNCKALTDFVFPNSVTTIGNTMFVNCSNLVSVKLSENMTEMTYAMFQGCTNLTNVTIPKNITTLSTSVFNNATNLKNITLGNVSKEFADTLKSLVSSSTDLKIVIESGVTSIPDRAFQSWKNVKRIELPSTVTSIGYGAFYLNYMQSIFIPNTLTTIGEYAFEQCLYLNSITIPSSVTTIGKGAFRGCSKATSIQFNGQVEIINDSTFEYCTKVEEIILPSTVKEIGYKAFERCFALKTIVLPNSITSIGESAFDQCSALSSITIPSSVTSIGACAFASSGLSSIIIPSSVTSLGNGSFAYCSSLTSARMMCQIESLVVDVFYDCNNLTEVVLPNTLKEIGLHAFYNCTSLTTMTFPQTLENIEPTAFENCNNLYQIKTYTLNSNVLSAINNLTPSQGSYEVIIGEGVTEIPEKAFYTEGITRLISKVEIPSTVTSIGDWAFYDCKLLTSVVIPGSVQTIGNAAFYQTGVTSVEIQEGVITLADHAFKNCTSLTEIDLPNSLQAIGGKAFESCTSLENITLPNQLTTLGAHAFYGCTSLQSIAIPGSLQKLKQYTFNGCTQLATVTLNSGLKEIESHVFYGCSSLSSIVLPNTIEIIRTEAFRNTSISSVVIPESVYLVGKCSFANDNLISITFNNLDGWYYGSSSESTKEESETADVSSPTANATKMNAMANGTESKYHFLRQPVV